MAPPLLFDLFESLLPTFGLSFNVSKHLMGHKLCEVLEIDLSLLIVCSVICLVVPTLSQWEWEAYHNFLQTGRIVNFVEMTNIMENVCTVCKCNNIKSFWRALQSSLFVGGSFIKHSIRSSCNFLSLSVPFLQMTACFNVSPIWFHG